MTDVLKELKLKFALRLFELEAIEFGEQKLKLHEKDPDAPLSPFFLNLRSERNPKPGPLTPKDFYNAADLMFRMVSRQDVVLWYTHVAGIPNAGTPFAEAFYEVACEADQSHYDLLWLDKLRLPNGKRQIGEIEYGRHNPGDRVILVDDLITRADSKLEAMASLRKANLEIAGLIVLVDREQGGAEKIKASGVPFVSVYTLTELLGIYVDQGLIKPSVRKCCLGYHDALIAYYASKAKRAG